MRTPLGSLFGPKTDKTPKNALTAWGPWGGGTNHAGVTVNNDTSLNLSAVWACETLIADAIATLPVDVYRNEGSARVEVPAPSWLTDPNPETDVVDFDTQRVLSLLGWGNCYTLLVRQGGAPAPAPIVHRWVLDPAAVKVDRDAQGKFVYSVNGKPTRPGDIQHIAGYRKPGQALGMSVVSNAAQSMGLGIAAEKFGAKFLQNGAHESGVLEVPAMPEDADDAVIAQLSNQFQARHGGVDNMHKPIVLTGGTTWKTASVNPEDSQLLETRQFQVAEIARWFRVPPHMIGDVERSTSWGTGIENQGIGFVTYTLRPWIIRLERADSVLLARPRFCKRNVNALLRGDSKARSDWYTAGLAGGYLTVPEIRAWEELPPLPDTPDPEVPE